MSTTPELKLRLLADTFAVHRMNPQMAVPAAVFESTPHFIAQTEEELSIVCKDNVFVQSERCESDWACFQVIGPLDFTLVGIIARISQTLASERISIFVISTFDTDYILVKNADLDRALRVLRSEGYGL
jgi:hypothetical protein